jgi:hypothetical protein
MTTYAAGPGVLSCDGKLSVFLCMGELDGGHECFVTNKIALVDLGSGQPTHLVER